MKSASDLDPIERGRQLSMKSATPQRRMTVILLLNKENGDQEADLWLLSVRVEDNDLPWRLDGRRILVRRILVYQGSSADIIFLEPMIALSISEEDLTLYHETNLFGFNVSKT